MEYSELFGSRNVMRIAPLDRKKDLINQPKGDLLLFGKTISHNYLETQVTLGATFKSIDLTEKYTYEDYQKEHPKAIEIGIITSKNILKLFYAGHKLKATEGCKLLVYQKD